MLQPGGISASIDRGIAMQQSINNAVKEFEHALGPEKVAFDSETIEKYARTTQSQAPAPSLILYPESTEEVQVLTRIASEHDVVLYPISCGKNWGYGDACAPFDGSAIVDHVLTTSGMEIVLADGRVLNTGFGHYEDSKTTHLYPYGIGPYMDGIFTQSNYGIFTKVGLWLMPEPEAFNFFFFQVKEHEDLAQIVDRLRPLRLNGTLTTAIHIGNDFRMLASSSRYPLGQNVRNAPPP